MILHRHRRDPLRSGPRFHGVVVFDAALIRHVADVRVGFERLSEHNLSLSPVKTCPDPGELFCVLATPSLLPISALAPTSLMPS